MTDGAEVNFNFGLHFLRICIVFLACRHPFISMHFVSSSMLKEAEHQLLQAQFWRSLKFAFGPHGSVV